MAVASQELGQQFPEPPNKANLTILPDVPKNDPNLCPCGENHIFGPGHTPGYTNLPTPLNEIQAVIISKPDKTRIRPPEFGESKRFV